MILYESVGEVPTNRSVIPQGCLTFAEQSLYVAEFAEENFNAMFESIGVEELAVFESTGCMIIYEGAKLKEFKEKVIGLFHKIFGAIKDAYEKILDFFEKKRKESVANLIKIDNSVLKYMKDGETYYTTHDFNINGLDDAFEKNARALLLDITDKFEELVQHPSDDLKSRGDELKEQFMNKIVKEVSGIENVKTFNEARKPLYNKLLGNEVKVTKDWVQKNLKELTGIVEQGNTKRDIQASYKREKATFDKLIKTIKGSTDDNLIKVANAEISVLKSTVTALHSCMNVKIDVCKRRYSEYRIILSKLAKLKKSSVSESYIGGYSYQEDLVEAAFDW